ncbi:DUF1446 domain-containing protein [Allokutzneria multivorans]|uniref:DUF1446 domain-containing protein n=1 Tax=Allokutzneria multivorans TaxID=1142134 RepID=A0ABP7RZR4_9PSEU
MSAGSPLLIGNASGFYGDRFDAVREMLDGGPLHVLTGDYLAELTMLILGRDRMKDPKLGYAKTFLRQMEANLGLAKDKGVRIVANAGGLTPAGLADALRELVQRLGLAVSVAHVEGDDLRERAVDLGLARHGPGQPLTANAYLGAWGIAECLRAGADVVVTGRVTDASLVVGPAIAHFGWSPRDLDQLAGATAAGHVLECGTQATGGNYSFFTEIADPSHPGFPVAELHADGSSVITKHPGTGGAVTVDTVTAQLLYEIGGADYPGPDVTARFDTAELTQQGPDRVRIAGVRGFPPPSTLKVCLNSVGGWRNATTFALCGLDVEAKADLARGQLESAIGTDGLTWTLARTDHPDADTEEAASALLHVTIKTSDPKRAKAFSRAAIELALASYPGFHVTAPPSDGTPFGVYRAGYVAREDVQQVAVLPGGERVEIADAVHDQPERDLSWEDEVPPSPSEPTTAVPLGTLFGARSGDKGGDANLGVWARSDAGFRWLVHELSVDRLRHLLPEVADLEVERHQFPNLRAVNFVVHGLLGEGVASSTRFDPQAKALGEWLRARVADLPVSLVEGAR